MVFAATAPAAATIARCRSSSADHPAIAAAVARGRSRKVGRGFAFPSRRDVLVYTLAQQYRRGIFGEPRSAAQRPSVDRGAVKVRTLVAGGAVKTCPQAAGRVVKAIVCCHIGCFSCEGTGVFCSGRSAWGGAGRLMVVVVMTAAVSVVVEVDVGRSVSCLIHCRP